VGRAAHVEKAEVRPADTRKRGFGASVTRTIAGPHAFTEPPLLVIDS